MPSSEEEGSKKLKEKLVRLEKQTEKLKEKIGKEKKEKFGERIRMEVIEEMFDEFDTIFIKYSKKHDVNFMEIDTCLLMLKKKIQYEQLRTWAPSLFDTEPTLNNTGNMYG